MTQYELLTAAAFVAFAAARVKFAVIEAGLGGRLDATNVIPSKLDRADLGRARPHRVARRHARGDRRREAGGAARPHDADHGDAARGGRAGRDEREARHARRERDIRLARWSRHGRRSSTSRAGYPEPNFALAAGRRRGRARATSSTRRRSSGPPSGLSIPGRAQVIEGDPRVILDAAHNPAGRPGARPRAARAGGRARASSAASPCSTTRTPRASSSALAPAVHRASSAPRSRAEAMRGRGPPGRSLRAGRGARRVRARGRVEAEAVADPEAAWERARELARERGAVALAAGSHYLLGSLWTERPAESS